MNLKKRDINKESKTIKDVEEINKVIIKTTQSDDKIATEARKSLGI